MSLYVSHSLTHTSTRTRTLTLSHTYICMYAYISHTYANAHKRVVTYILTYNLNLLSSPFCRSLLLISSSLLYLFFFPFSLFFSSLRSSPLSTFPLFSSPLLSSPLLSSSLQVLKMILLGCPLFLGTLLLAAWWVVTGGPYCTVRIGVLEWCLK